MGAGKLFTTLVIVVLNLALWIFLETKLERFFTLELVLVVLGILLSLILLVSITTRARWAWAFGTIFFSLALANSLFLFWNTRAWGSFLLLLLLNTFGLLMSILSSGTEDEEDLWEGGTPEPSSPEVYDADHSKKVTYKAPKTLKKRKKKR